MLWNSPVLFPKGKPVADFDRDDHEVRALQRPWEVRSARNPVAEAVLGDKGASGRMHPGNRLCVDVVERDLGIREDAAGKDVPQRSVAELGASCSDQDNLRHSVILLPIRLAASSNRWQTRKPSGFSPAQPQAQKPAAPARGTPCSSAVRENGRARMPPVPGGTAGQGRRDDQGIRNADEVGFEALNQRKSARAACEPACGGASPHPRSSPPKDCSAPAEPSSIRGPRDQPRQGMSSHEAT